MINAIGIAWLVATFAVVALGAPADIPISFLATTASPRRNPHDGPSMASVCVNMMAAHRTAAMTGEPPYAIRISQTTAEPGDTVQVTLIGLQSEEYRGVYVQGRHEETPVGQFLPAGDDSPPVSLFDCPPGTQNAASYISKQPITELTLDYVVPDVPSVVFKATFVKSYSVFWAPMSSETLLVTKRTE